MKILFVMLVAVVMIFPFGAMAEDKSLIAAEDGWNISAGAGLLVSPSYLGDDEYQFMAVPNIRMTYADKFFASIQEGAGYNLINNKHWRVGPLVRYDFGRDEDGDNTFRVGGDDTNDLRGLGDVDGTVELGGFIEYKMQPVSAKVEILQGVGGHEGMSGSAGLKYNGRTQLKQKALMYSFGSEIKFADSNYHEAYFGVDVGQSVASGLAQYKPDAGILTYGVGASIIMPITDKVATVLFTNYNRLGDEAANSSLVEERGSANQGTAGLFINYSF